VSRIKIQEMQSEFWVLKYREKLSYDTQISSARKIFELVLRKWIIFSELDITDS
jgi:hypothetical protein